MVLERCLLGLCVLALACCCLVAGVESPPATRPAARDLNPQIMALGDNTWLKMNPPREPAGRNYSCPCGGEGRIWYWGGGHFSYDRNDVDFYDMAANTWTRSYKPERNPWGAKNRWAISPREGSPAPRHTYQQVCWLPERNVFFYMPGIDTWQFDPGKMTWTCLAGVHSTSKAFSPKPQGIQNAHCFYSPQLKAPIAIMTTGDTGTYLFDYEKRQWRKRKAVPRQAVWNELYSTCVPPLGCQLISQGHEPFMWTYNVATEEWKALTDVPEPLRGCQALAYDSTNRVVVAVRPVGKGNGPLGTWVLDPKALKWTALTASGPVPKGWGKWAPLWYDPAHNAFFFLNRTGQTGCETWVYRYRRVAKTGRGSQ